MDAEKHSESRQRVLVLSLPSSPTRVFGHPTKRGAGRQRLTILPTSLQNHSARYVTLTHRPQEGKAHCSLVLSRASAASMVPSPKESIHNGCKNEIFSHSTSLSSVLTGEWLLSRTGFVTSGLRSSPGTAQAMTVSRTCERCTDCGRLLYDAWCQRGF